MAIIEADVNLFNVQEITKSMQRSEPSDRDIVDLQIDTQPYDDGASVLDEVWDMVFKKSEGDLSSIELNNSGFIYPGDAEPNISPTIHDEHIYDYF